GFPRSYVAAAEPVRVERRSDRAVAVAGVDAVNGLEKRIDVELDARGTRVRVRHQLSNLGETPFDAAAWALTILAPGGVAVLPAEPWALFFFEQKTAYEI